MEKDTSPNPDRFEVFTELANGKGFKIKNSQYIYFFDKYGGWYDEFNNYYNADGDNEDPPSDEDEDFERVVLQSDYDHGGDDDDYYDNLYGGGGHNEDYDEDLDEEEQEDNEYEQAVLEKFAETKKQSDNKKKYFAKNQTRSQTKKQQAKIAEEPKKEEKVQLKWYKYHAQMTVFPKKDSFKQWMQKYGFVENEHFKNLLKVSDSKQSKELGKRYATVELRSDVFEKIQGQQYQKTKIQFERME